jgi:hypothetical protein
MGGQRVRRRCVGEVEVEVVTERTARVGGEVRDGESSAEPLKNGAAGLGTMTAAQARAGKNSRA